MQNTLFMKNFKTNWPITLAFVQALVATLGSLYFSEIKHWRPCVLCWYQRISMYPLVIIFLMALWKKDTKVFYYALPMSLVGLGIALYHNLLQWGVLTEQCSLTGVSCTTKFAGWFGFVTIPLLSLTAFWIISLLMVIQIKRARKAS